MSSHFEACIFDIDGTIVNSHELGHEATNAVLLSAGLGAITAEEYVQGCSLSTPRRLAWHVTGDPDDACGAALGAAFDRLYVTQVSDTFPPLFREAEACIEALRAARPALRFGLVTNAAGAYARAIAAAHGGGCLRGFDVIVGADDVARAKPSADGLLAAAAALRLPPGACAYVGDAVTDGQAARAAGMRAYGAAWGLEKSEAPPPAWRAEFDDVAADGRSLAKALLDWRQ
jgi:HAD superfamily hydrolase (TIGR01509 family)